MNKLLGQKVELSNQLGVRKRVRNQFGAINYEWSVEVVKKVTGIICGKRKKLNGHWDWYEGIDYDSGYRFFYVTKEIDCYIVAISMNQTVLVPIEHCTLINEVKNG